MSKELFDDIHHIALVVYEANKTASYFEKIGLGPWQDYPPMTHYKNVTGINVDDFVDIKFKVLDLGKIHIQLCQPGIGDSPIWRAHQLFYRSRKIESRVLTLTDQAETATRDWLRPRPHQNAQTGSNANSSPDQTSLWFDEVREFIKINKIKDYPVVS